MEFQNQEILEHILFFENQNVNLLLILTCVLIITDFKKVLFCLDRGKHVFFYRDLTLSVFYVKIHI